MAKGVQENEKWNALGMGGDIRCRFPFGPLLFLFSLPASLFLGGLGVSFLRAENVAGFSSYWIIGPNHSWIFPHSSPFFKLQALILSSG
jgi:hypothetical protein